MIRGRNVKQSETIRGKFMFRVVEPCIDCARLIDVWTADLSKPPICGDCLAERDRKVRGWHPENSID